MGAVQRRVRYRICWTTDRHTVVRMLNSPGNHGHSLGLSVGATNLAGTRDGQSAAELVTELQQFARTRLAEYKRPRWVEFVDALPTTATGKVLRFKLRERAVQGTI